MRYLFNFCMLLLPPTRLFGAKRFLARKIGIKVGDGVCLNGHIFFFGSGIVTIGKNTWVGLKNTFYCTQLAKILIGENCDIGPDVAFVSGSHEIGGGERRAGSGTGGNIVIGDGCWRGARVTVLGGVTIGNGSIIGAGSLVNKDVPANTMYAGVPAKLIRTLDNA